MVIICFTEGLLTDTTFPWQSFHSLRHSNGRGRGLSVYVRYAFQVELSHISVSLPIIESLFLKICPEAKQKTSVGTICKPPLANCNEFVYVNRVNLSYITLCGDFNLYLLNSDMMMADLSVIKSS